jgi:hypothetical protein
MTLDFDKLWEPYSMDGCTLEAHVNWCLKDAAKKGIDPQIANAAVQLMFMEMQNGRTFSKGECPCGCDGPNVHTAVNHATVLMASEMDRERREETARALAGTLNAAIESHVARIEAERAPKPKGPGIVKRSWSALWSPTR